MGAEAHRCARATIEYDGTAFAGSQVQPNARTVQGELEGALNRLIGERIRVRLAGRTDAGVHATGQVAAFCLTRALPWKGGLPELRRRLNAVLPRDLAVRALRWAPLGFDPRRDALWRVYRYRIRIGGGANGQRRQRGDAGGDERGQDEKVCRREPAQREEPSVELRRLSHSRDQETVKALPAAATRAGRSSPSSGRAGATRARRESSASPRSPPRARRRSAQRRHQTRRRRARSRR